VTDGESLASKDAGQALVVGVDRGLCGVIFSVIDINIYSNGRQIA
jgi:hypothetical protein